VRGAGARLDPQLAADDLSDMVVADVEQVVPGGLAWGGARHAQSILGSKAGGHCRPFSGVSLAPQTIDKTPQQEPAVL
jgi:hypothetical protein